MAKKAIHLDKDNSYLCSGENIFFATKHSKEIALKPLLAEIDLKKSEVEGKIKRLDPELAQTQKMLKEYKEVFVNGLDAGERDAITILNSDSYDEYLFCSGINQRLKPLRL
jgi:hypothetical protein